MRVVSWTVVFGAVSALVYTGFKPFWQDLELPEIGADQVRGTVVAPGREKDRPALAQDDERHAQKPTVCREPLRDNDTDCDIPQP